MPLFRYDAVDSKGSKTGGILDAESIGEAKRKLLEQAIFLTRISPLGVEVDRWVLKKGEVLNLTRELARLLKAGLPLYESLSAMEEKYRGHKAQKILLDLCEQVRGGNPFSLALARHGKTFDLLYTAMVANAERTGRLSEALDELSALLFKQQQIRKQLVSALLYPALLFGFCLFVLGSLLFYVIPSLQELFEGRPLQPITEVVFAMSRIACESRLYLALIAISIFIGGWAATVSPKCKRVMGARINEMPWIGPLMAKVALIRFSRAAATLLDGGVPIVTAFARSREIMGHSTLQAVVETAELKIAQGEPIHSAFKGKKGVPPLVPRMLGIAEETGNLPSMMRQIADIYEEDIERTLAHFSTMAQPALLLLLGAIVGLVLLSVLLPLTDVSSFATN